MSIDTVISFEIQCTVGRETTELINRMIERPISPDFPSTLIHSRGIDPGSRLEALRRGGHF